MLTNWFLYALLSLLSYGLWGFFSKLATNYISPSTALAYDILGALLVVLASSALAKDFQWQGDGRGIVYAILTGVVGAVASFFYLLALTKGLSSVVLPLTSLYPTITVLLAFCILKEPITIRQCIGILLAAFAIVLCSEAE